MRSFLRSSITLATSSAFSYEKAGSGSSSSIFEEGVSLFVNGGCGTHCSNYADIIEGNSDLSCVI
jgi:hypothetical protein